MERRLESVSEPRRGTEVEQRPADGGEADHRVERVRGRPHVADPDEIACALTAGDHDAVARPAVVADLSVRQSLGESQRRGAGRCDLFSRGPEFEIHGGGTGSAHGGGSLVPLERSLEALAEDDVTGSLDAVEVDDRRRERELAVLEPLLLPV